VLGFCQRKANAPCYRRPHAYQVGTPPIPPAVVLRYGLAVPISDVLRNTILRRLRSLDRIARDVVMRASVVGHEFDPHIVAATSTRSEADVRAALEQACSLQLVIASSGDRFAFRHALVRDIIYSELLDARIRPLHRRIARALERMRCSRDVPLEEIAYHSWAGGDGRRALCYNERAGDHAIIVHAREDAQRYYSRARSMTEIGSAAYLRLTQKLQAIGAE
jgi:predicted ATPase